MRRVGVAPHLILCLVLLLASFALASTPTSFCKCTCFTNSTIIPLDEGADDVSSSFSGFRNLIRFYDEVDANAKEKRAKKYHALNCNDCNRKFCLDYDLPMCQTAKEEDVFTTCFQRDSRKDEAVVFIFIFATSGLLTWAALKPWVERYMEAARERRSYIPVSAGDAHQ
ncbi:hypothetical protein ASPZODRAFT_133328 [Penicilliopsis zonata CBS 506.65]|uniref:Uncharacterized protein n=1 Tax=Penicilliopsis zonata CBS 506.65 TaxID=1073090 RepID=A0A1L9SGN8_9EURO|nr:hypothetical protein ASPZODRAFT_133328 [Penicilliopsis zonata CBS 506.65]OJJ46298.1 hypothetical protein ASPZODRAFT_133328 [Penicilliopsis zonata CBS 506.65]